MSWSDSTLLTRLTDYLLAKELRAMYFSQLDIAEILLCHQRAHDSTMAVVISLSEDEVAKMLNDEKEEVT